MAGGVVFVAVVVGVSFAGDKCRRARVCWET